MRATSTTLMPIAGVTEMRIFKQRRDSRAIPVDRGLAIIWLLFMTLAVSPLYIEGTRAILLRAFHAQLTLSNRDAFSLAAFCIFIPIAYSWMRSKTLGLWVHFGSLVSIVAWLYVSDRSILTTWRSYAGTLFAVCAATAFIVSMMVVGKVFWRSRR